MKVTDLPWVSKASTSSVPMYPAPMIATLRADAHRFTISMACV